MGDNVLPATIVRAIGNKLYDRRKEAALELESLIKTLAAQGNSYRINLIVNRIVNNYAFSPQTNYRKGGLLCLAAATVALSDLQQEERREYMDVVVPAVLNSLVDQDARVRYYALEALFNIAKVTREGFMPFFADTFETLFRLSGDMDSAVQLATTYLDNLLKDIVTASPDFDVEAFIPQLREFLQVQDLKQSVFLIQWITLLASVPDVDMLSHLPQILGGLLDSMTTNFRDVTEAAGRALDDFLADIDSGEPVDFNSMAHTLCQKANKGHDVVQMISMRWLRRFILLAKARLKEQYADILAAVLPILSHSSPGIAAEAEATNKELLDLPDGWEGHDTRQILAVISAELGSQQEATRLAALHWMTSLFKQSCSTVMESMDLLLPALLDALNAPSEKVVTESLKVQASIAEDGPRFKHLMRLLLDRFRGTSGAKLLAKRGSLVVRTLAEFLGGEKVLSALSANLEEEANVQFAANVVQALNLILLTAPEMREVRQALAGQTNTAQGARLFKALFRSWSHSAGAALCLCYLAQAYEHADNLIGIFRDVSMSIETLVQIDRLVQILETPVFTALRLHLLQPAQHPALLRSMYGLLMLLPQSNAFRTLHARLNSVPALTLLQLGGASPGLHQLQKGNKGKEESLQDHIDFEDLHDLFRSRQETCAAAEEARSLAGLSADSELETRTQNAEDKQPPPSMLTAMGRSMSS